jgi:N-methylhydantoinase A
VAVRDHDLRRAIEELLDAGAEAIAVSFLWSILNPGHELLARAVVEELAPSVFVTCSHEVTSNIGEYYRTVATVMNAYVGPLMNRYVGGLAERAERSRYSSPVLFAQAVGGVARVEEVRRRPLLTLDSGPVSGMVAAKFLADAMGLENVITADMGGTTFDVGLIVGGSAKRRDTTNIGGYEMYLPMLDVESIGAGGGSIAWLDPGSDTIKVGPRSAGAVPGPMCYGLGGTEPTVTDADIVLGVINPERFLGGRRRLDADAARRGLASLGAPLGMSAEETAAGVSRIVDNAMAEKIRRMTLFRGHDPRGFVVFAFGGASPSHAGGFAADLGVSAVVIPGGNTASVLSALGTICGDLTQIVDRPVRYVAPFDMSAIEGELSAVGDEATRSLAADGAAENLVLDEYVSMKYGAQVFDLEIPYRRGAASDDLVRAFDAAYTERYGSGAGYPEAGIELIRLRVQARSTSTKPKLGQGVEPDQGPSIPHESRAVWWRETGGLSQTDVYDRVGTTSIVGPAICELPDTTIVVRPGHVIETDELANLIMTMPRNDGRDMAGGVRT